MDATPHLPPLPPVDQLTASRLELQRIATHVLARRRFEVTGRFGLRVRAGAIATPMFGDEEVLRLSGEALVHEHRTDDGPRSDVIPLTGASLRTLATAAGADLDAEFSAGADTPPVGDGDAPVAMPHAAVLLGWFELGAAVLDHVLAGHADAAPSVPQLWPEHFDLGVDVATGSSRANLGVSPGDGGVAEPYLYIGPWSADRPGDADFWNASFGAVLRYGELERSDHRAAAAAFFERGLDLLS